MDRRELIKAICMDCPNTFTYFQSLPEHPLFLSAIAKAYHEQWFRDFQRFLILEGYVTSGKSTFVKFLRLLGDSSGNNIDISLSDFNDVPEEILMSKHTAISLFIDGTISRNTLDMIKKVVSGDYLVNYSQEQIKSPLIILHTQRRLTELENSEGMLRRQLVIKFQPLRTTKIIHNYLEQQQISQEIPAFINCLASMSKDDCLAILTTADRNLLTAK